ncbi:SMI1/KNR4 family protein [Flavobacterium rhizosphaerae]|uniref:SMI1/KNR4 family protein n=1 Tax=Flavobacterium rhizosphaerae TaxID=3163298 RepID=A0ABW8YS30_9FLAO
MPKKLLLLFLFAVSVCMAQNLPDSIQVSIDVYGVSFSGKEFKYKSTSLNLTNNKGNFFIGGHKIQATTKQIEKFVAAVQTPMDFDAHFNNLGIDTLQIKNKSEKLLKQGDFEWITEQKAYILPLLADIENYKALYEEDFYTGLDFSVGLRDRTKKQFIIKFFSRGRLTYSGTTTLSRTGYNLPWLDMVSGTENYNPKLEPLFATLMGDKISVVEGKELTASLAERIIKNNALKLYELGAKKYKTEIDELATDFTIEKAELNRKKEKEYIIKLHNSSMLPNMYINFFATENNHTLYTRDSLKENYKTIVERVKAIDFISDYLNSNPKTRLYIKYYNGSAISTYDINRVNTNQKLWKAHDKYAEKQMEYLRKNPRSSEYVLFNINYSEEKNCGCNLRLDEGTIKKAITFEIVNDDNEGYSLWFLLPDNRVLLYLMDGEKTLNYTYKTWGNNYPGLQTPCKIFNLKGEPENYTSNNYTSGMYQMVSSLFEKSVTLKEGNSYTEKQRETKWIGNPGAQEDEIKAAEMRLGITLPDDYKKFLLIANGYKTCFRISEPSFFMAENIEYLNKVDPNLVKLWNEHIEDETYKTKFASAIIVGGGFLEPQLFLLIPPTGINGKWEYWKFTGWLPGEIRYENLTAYFISVINFIDTVNP